MSFWQNRRVLVTGHTGFKGSWLCLWLERLGAQVIGIAQPPHTDPNLYTLLSPWPALDHRIANEVHNSPYYRTAAVVPYYIGSTEGTYIIYRYEPPK